MTSLARWMASRMRDTLIHLGPPLSISPEYLTELLQSERDGHNLKIFVLMRESALRSHERDCGFMLSDVQDAVDNVAEKFIGEWLKEYNDINGKVGMIFKVFVAMLQKPPEVPEHRGETRTTRPNVSRSSQNAGDVTSTAGSDNRGNNKFQTSSAKKKIRELIVRLIKSTLQIGIYSVLMTLNDADGPLTLPVWSAGAPPGEAEDTVQQEQPSPRVLEAHETANRLCDCVEDMLITLGECYWKPSAKRTMCVAVSEVLITTLNLVAAHPRGTLRASLIRDIGQYAFGENGIHSTIPHLAHLAHLVNQYIPEQPEVQQGLMQTSQGAEGGGGDHQDQDNEQASSISRETENGQIQEDHKASSSPTSGQISNENSSSSRTGTDEDENGGIIRD